MTLPPLPPPPPVFNVLGHARHAPCRMPPTLNSTFKMLVKIIRLKTPLKSFLDYLTSPEGKREFNRKVLPRVDETEWALVTGMCILLQPFNKITGILSGEKYPTFVYALLYLASIHSFLRNDNLFSVNVTNVDDATVGVKLCSRP